MRGKVFEIGPVIQFPDTFVVSTLRANFRELHDLSAVDKKNVWKAIEIPQLEERHVQTDMAGIETGIFGKELKDPVQVLDVIDVLHK